MASRTWRFVSSSWEPMIVIRVETGVPFFSTPMVDHSWPRSVKVSWGMFRVVNGGPLGSLLFMIDARRYLIADSSITWSTT